MVKDLDILNVIRNLLLSQTDAEDRVYTWKTTKQAETTFPIIDLRIPTRALESQGQNSAHYQDVRTLTVFLAVSGLENSDVTTGGVQALDLLDDLEAQVSDVLDVAPMPDLSPLPAKRFLKVGVETNIDGSTGVVLGLRTISYEILFSQVTKKR